MYDMAKYMAGLLKPHVRHTETSVKNSMEMVTMLDIIKLPPDELLVSLDVVLLYTKIPLQPMIDLLATVLPSEILELFKFILTSMYFVFEGEFYEQTEGVPMGSPLSPIIPELYMESFEHPIAAEGV